MRIVGLVGLVAGVLVFGAGCRREPVTEADLQRAIEERQSATHAEIERTVTTAPPPIVLPEQSEQGASGQGIQPSTPNQTPEFVAPTSPQGRPSNLTPPPPTTTTRELGDIELDPKTGEYGIRPPGAPEGYNIPLNSPRNAPAGQPTDQ